MILCLTTPLYSPAISSLTFIVLPPSVAKSEMFRNVRIVKTICGTAWDGAVQITAASMDGELQAVPSNLDELIQALGRGRLKSLHGSTR